MELVPQLQQRERRTLARLSTLDSLTEELSDLERTQFRSYLVGSLCALTGDEDWAAAIGGAMRLANALWKKQQQEANEPDSGEPFS